MVTRKNLLKQLTQERPLMNFARHSIKDPRAKIVPKAFSRQTFRNSVYERRTIAPKKDGGELTSDEKTLVYYLVNLILFKKFNMAN